MENHLKEELEACVLAAVRSVTGQSDVRISGFLRLESSTSDAREICVAFGGKTQEQSKPPSIFHNLPPPRQNRRKAYHPKRVVQTDLTSDEEPEMEVDVQPKVTAMLPVVSPGPELTEPILSGLERRKNNRPAKSASSRRQHSREFTCNQCMQKFRSLGTLTEHTIQFHGNFRCRECDAKFTQRSNLQRHTLKHLGFKPFKCSICDREYYRKDHLVRHIEVSHPGVEARQCVVSVLGTAECLRRGEAERESARTELPPVETPAKDENRSPCSGVTPETVNNRPVSSGLTSTFSSVTLEEPQDLRISLQQMMNSLQQIPPVFSLNA